MGPGSNAKPPSRAAYFLDNWKAVRGALPALPTFIPAQLAIPQVSTRDIGRVAAAALIEGGHGQQIIEPSGPRDVSPADVAAALSATPHEAPLDAVVPTFTGFGMSTAVAELYREMYAGIIAGRVAWQGGAARAVRGRVTIEDALGGMLPAS